MKTFLICLMMSLVPAVATAELPKNLPAAIPLWSKGAPGSESRANEKEEWSGDNCGNVHNPTLTPFVPDLAKSLAPPW